MSSLVAAIAVVLNGVAVGIMASTVIGIVPYMLAQNYGGYVRMVHFMWPRFDPTMPILNGTVLVLDIGLAVAATDTAVAAGFGCAAALLLIVMAISITKNVPVNKMIKALDPDRRPGDWDTIDPRRRWQGWNATRTAIASTAFLINVFTAVTVG